MNPFDRRRFLRMVGQAAAAGVISTATAEGLVQRADAQTSPGLLPEGRRFVHLNFSNGGMGWLFTMLLPPNYLDGDNRGQMAMWYPDLPIEEVVTASGGRFVIPTSILEGFEASGDRAAFERVLDGCICFLGCGPGAPIHQTYAPSFQFGLGARTTDVSSEVARYQNFATKYPMVNMSGSRLYGTGLKSFIGVLGNDISQLFNPVTTAPGFNESVTMKLADLVNRLNGAKGPYARTFAGQLLAGREASSLFAPDQTLAPQLAVDLGIVRDMQQMRLPIAEQPFAVQLGRLDIADEYTQGGVQTYNVGDIEMGLLGQSTTNIVRGVAGALQAMELGVGAENIQIDGVQDDPHNAITLLHGIADRTDVGNAMLLKLNWALGFLVELEKRGLYQDTTVLIDGDFSRVLNRQWDDGGVNGLMIFSGTGRLRPGFYGDSGVTSGGGVWYQFPDIRGAASAQDGNFPQLLPQQSDAGSDLPSRLALGIILYGMGMDVAQAAAASQLREDEVALISPFAKT